MIKNKKPTMVVVSPIIRRDMQSSFQMFKKIKIIHLYKQASYEDMEKNDFNENTLQYFNFFDLLIKIKKTNPDIIQGSEVFWFPFSLIECCATYLMSRLLKKPLILPAYEIVFPEKKYGYILGKLVKLINKIYCNQAKVIFYVSNKAKINYVNSGVNKNKFIKNLWGLWGVDTKEFIPDIKNKKLTDQKPRILFVGNLVYRKGIVYLLESFLQIKKEEKNAKLYIVGKGKMEADIKKFAYENNLIKDIVLFGVVKNQNIPKMYHKATISVLPSITMNRTAEQLGMVNIQSLACGIPIVTTDCGAITEFIHHNYNGLVVPEKNSLALADACLNLIKNPKLRRRLSVNGRKYVVTNFDNKKNIQQTENIILDMLAKFL